MRLWSSAVVVLLLLACLSSGETTTGKRKVKKKQQKKKEEKDWQRLHRDARQQAAEGRHMVAVETYRQAISAQLQAPEKTKLVTQEVRSRSSASLYRDAAESAKQAGELSQAAAWSNQSLAVLKLGGEAMLQDQLFGFLGP